MRRSRNKEVVALLDGEPMHELQQVWEDDLDERSRRHLRAVAMGEVVDVRAEHLSHGVEDLGHRLLRVRGTGVGDPRVVNELMRDHGEETGHYLVLVVGHCWRRA